MTTNYVVIAAFIGSLGLHAGAAKAHFTSPDGIPPRLKLISGLFLVFAATSLRILTIAPIDPESAAVAICLYVLAAILFFSAIGANRHRPLTVAFTNDAPGHLVTAGPYRYIRHPFYSSYCFTWLAGAVASHSPMQFGIFLCMGLIYVWAAQYEEGKFATSELSSEYAQYRTRTGMFLPKWRTIRGRRFGISLPSGLPSLTDQRRG
jgi:protein-S-isoprenylcysteine O-methyltransferase Ste14